MYKWSCIFTFLVLCSTCVHVCIYGHGRAAFWLNGHLYDIDIDIDSAETASLSAEAKTKQQAFVNICVHCLTEDENM